MSERSCAIVQNAPTKKWSVVDLLYTFFAVTFFLWDYGCILLTKYRRAAPLGLIVGVGFLQYFAFLVYVIVALCSIPYWIMNRKKAPARAATPISIVCVELIVYALYVIFIAPHIDGGGVWFRFILFEIERFSA